MSLIAKDPITVDTIIEATKLHKSQVATWLKLAVDTGSIKKITRPVRYQIK